MDADGGGPFRFRPARLRFPAEHPFFEDGDVHRHLQLQGALPGASTEEQREGTPEFSCHVPGCRQVFGTLESFEHHYNLLHRSVCSSCRRSFPSAHLLELHVLEWHDSLFQLMAEKHSMYQCLVESCLEKFQSRKDRKEHLVKVHCYPSDFRFDQPMKFKSTKAMRSPSRDSIEPMDVRPGEDCKESAVVAMEVGPSESTMENVLQPGVENTVAFPSSEKWLYRSRIPTTICFGPGATRGFKGRKKKA
ncbi:zinc finger protein 511 isoform X2 [Rhineura floridana]|uniref:zinc finger protein 511 isoform X2 n=1 Tax=Rhineura floridana TaxID=261503 RepID=UPI002AC880DD|nr:zinc finger protein 511 isoform X2 [Rhineura floridana]